MANMQDFRHADTRTSKSDTDRDNDGSTIELPVAKRRVQDAMKWRKAAHYDENWAKLIKMYASQYDYPELSNYEDIIAPNLMFSTANVIIPSIVVNYPKITVSARTPQGEANAQIVEAAANYNWQRYDFHDELKLAIKDFVIIGHGWVKTTWCLKEETVDVPRDEWTEMAQMALQEKYAAMEKARTSGLGVTFPEDEEVLASVPTTKVQVTEDRPEVKRISPFDVYIDPDATRIEDARWIAQRLYIPLSEAKDNEDWDPKARKSLVGTAMSEAKKEYDLTFEGEDRGTETDFAVVWEYYDLLENAMCVFADGADKFLVKPEPVEWPFGHPFVPAWNYSIPEKLYPLGDLETILPLQMELALTRTQMVNDRKRFRRMYMYKPEELGPDGLAAITSSDDNALIPVDSDQPFSEIFQAVATSSLPPEFYNQTAMILDDMNMVSGVTEYQRGSVAEVRRTATEASMIQDMSNARSAEKLSKIESMISHVARQCVQLAQIFLSTEQVARITGPEGAVQWVPYTPDQVQGEYDFSVEAGSTQPMNESFRRQSAMQLLDAMAPFLQLGVIDPFKLAEHVLRNGFGIKDPSSFIAQPPPMAPGMGPGGVPPDAGMPPAM